MAQTPTALPTSQMFRDPPEPCFPECFLTPSPVCPQSFLYLGWYMVMSLLGHYNNFFFAAHLLDIAMGVKTLRTILSSVTHNGKQVGEDLTEECEPGRDELGSLSRGGGVRAGQQE